MCEYVCSYWVNMGHRWDYDDYDVEGKKKEKSQLDFPCKYSQIQYAYVHILMKCHHHTIMIHMREKNIFNSGRRKI